MKPDRLLADCLIARTCRGGCKTDKECLERTAREDGDILTAAQKLERAPGEVKPEESMR